MKKLIILGLALLMVVVFGTVALAEADEQELVPYLFDSNGAPMEPFSPDASGMAIVNYPEGDVVLVITVSVKGLDTGAEYEVKGCTSPEEGDWTLIGTFTTNKNGNGHFHRNCRADEEPLPPTGHIYINLPGTSNTVLMDEDYTP